MEQVDVVIVGLGPAGSTLARLLKDDFKVLCIDKKKKEKEGKVGSREEGFLKPCGGLLAPDAQKALSTFDLTLPKDILVDPQIFSVKTLDFKSRKISYYQRFYVNMDRGKLDRWLMSLIPSHVKVHYESTLVGIVRVGEKYRLTYMESGVEKVVETRYVAGADGATSKVRKYLYPKKKIRSYMAIQEWYREENSVPFYSCIFDPKRSDCYSWTISKDGYFIFGGAFPKDRGKVLFEEQKEELRQWGISIGEPVKREACLVLRPQGMGDFLCGKGNVFLVGEAGGFISTSSLEGISSAIKTARVLAQVLNEGAKDPGKAYRRKCAGIKRHLYGKIWKSVPMYTPFIRRLIMASGIKGIKVEDQLLK